MKAKILFSTILANFLIVTIVFTQDSIPFIILCEDTVLYVYPENNVNEIEWGGYGTSTNAISNNGAINTALIVQTLGDNNGITYAAKVCDTLTAFGYNDWYLPTIGELYVMCENCNLIGCSSQYYYLWSSNELSDTTVWMSYFGDCSGMGVPKDMMFSCRCVRREYVTSSSNTENLIKEVKIIPDLTNKEVNIRIKGITGEYELSIYNIQGNRMENRKIRITGDGYSGRIDVSGFAKGTYIVVVRNGKFVKTGKFVL